ncbi:hypothetical protein J6590_064304 [Homalodisca vitripennis]|nr:hypothetical protein J6590_064304 [Homalodisca vitripennis]
MSSAVLPSLAINFFNPAVYQGFFDRLFCLRRKRLEKRSYTNDFSPWSWILLKTLLYSEGAIVETKAKDYLGNPLISFYPAPLPLTLRLSHNCCPRVTDPASIRLLTVIESLYGRMELRYPIMDYLAIADGCVPYLDPLPNKGHQVVTTAAVNGTPPILRSCLIMQQFLVSMFVNTFKLLYISRAYNLKYLAVRSEDEPYRMEFPVPLVDLPVSPQDACDRSSPGYFAMADHSGPHAVQ